MGGAAPRRSSRYWNGPPHWSAQHSAICVVFVPAPLMFRCCCGRIYLVNRHLYRCVVLSAALTATEIRGGLLTLCTQTSLVWAVIPFAALYAWLHHPRVRILAFISTVCIATIILPHQPERRDTHGTVCLKGEALMCKFYYCSVVVEALWQFTKI